MNATLLSAIAEEINDTLTVISAHAVLIGVAPGDPHGEHLIGIGAAVTRGAALARRLALIAESA